LAALLVTAATPLASQNSGFDLRYGYWWHDHGATLLTASYQHRVWGALDYGIGLVHVRSFSEALSLRQTGGELSLALGRFGSGPYAVGTAALVMGHSDGNVAALWSAGVGWTFSPFRFLSLGLEGSYRVEDRQIHGFWRLQPDDLRGFAAQASVTVNLGGRGAAAPPATPVSVPQVQPPAEREISEAASRDGASEEAATLRTHVVETALGAMGAPYRWGGTDGNGFDCSGLIQYAYQQHGLILPRVSRDQARTGMQVDRDVGQLLPGDILGFTVERGGVTHVGLYVGDGMFIHSASDGVKLSNLTASDGENRWWRDRWVSARRVIN
jgi:cell wall-associated NlpC family hydrolase